MNSFMWTCIVMRFMTFILNGPSNFFKFLQYTSDVSVFTFPFLSQRTVYINFVAVRHLIKPFQQSQIKPRMQCLLPVCDRYIYRHLYVIASEVEAILCISCAPILYKICYYSSLTENFVEKSA